jgi:hypothetical protein
MDSRRFIMPVDAKSLKFHRFVIAPAEKLL